QAGSVQTSSTKAVGSYCWRAEYSGDTFNAPSTDSDPAAECFTTVKQDSTTRTQSSTTVADVPAGTSVTDTATVAGGVGTPTGSVSFFLCQPATVTANGGNCSSGGGPGTPAQSPHPARPAAPHAPASPPATGPSCWRAVYSGDDLYNGPAETSSTNECFTVVAAANTADLSVTKVASPGPVLAGTNLTYALSVHNAGPATATGVTLTDT